MRALFTTRPRNLGSALIRAREGSTASHCAVMLADGRVVESVWPLGRVHTPDEWAAHLQETGAVVVDSIALRVADEAAAEAEALSVVGKPYPLRALLAYVIWRDIPTGRGVECTLHLRNTLMAGGAYEPRDPALRRWGIATGREVCGLLAV